MKKQKERRRFPRVKISLPLTYHVFQEPFKKKARIRARTKDISEGGLAFISSNQPNTLVIDLSIQLPPKKESKKIKTKESKSKKIVNAKARIVWGKPLSKENRNIFTTGVCFLKLKKKDFSLLKAELKKHTK